MTPIRVLIADDSPLFVEVLRDLLEADPQIHVVGVARHGEEAVEMTSRLAPDLVTMDIEMPKLDGLDAVERIMSIKPTPILVLTADPRSVNRTWAFEALRRGALDLWPKPNLTSDSKGQDEEALREHIKLLATIHVVHHARVRAPIESATPESIPKRPGAFPGVVGIVASTGGPSVLAEILAGVPASFPLGIVIVQHLAPGFAPHLVAWLASVSPLKVSLAEQNALVEPGTVWVAPDASHTRVNGRGRLVLDFHTPAYEGHRPAGNILLQSIAESVGPGAIGAVLSGMGRDGSVGLLAMHNAGAKTLVQDAETSAIFGMPKVALDCGAAKLAVPRQRIATTLYKLAANIVGEKA